MGLEECFGEELGGMPWDKAGIITIRSPLVDSMGCAQNSGKQQLCHL